MKRWMALLLTLALMAAIAACDKVAKPAAAASDPAPTAAPANAPAQLPEQSADLQQIKDMIAQGNYEQAYAHLYAMEDRDAEAEALFSRFACLETERTDSEGYKSVCRYDVNGRVLEESTTDPSGAYGKRTYTYDENGNVLTLTYTDSDGYWEKTGYTYDAYGNVLTETYEDSEGEQWEYSYAYVVCYNPDGFPEASDEE